VWEDGLVQIVLHLAVLNNAKIMEYVMVPITALASMDTLVLIAASSIVQRVARMEEVALVLSDVAVSMDGVVLIVQALAVLNHVTTEDTVMHPIIANALEVTMDQIVPHSIATPNHVNTEACAFLQTNATVEPLAIMEMTAANLIAKIETVNTEVYVTLPITATADLPADTMVLTALILIVLLHARTAESATHQTTAPVPAAILETIARASLAASNANTAANALPLTSVTVPPLEDIME